MSHLSTSQRRSKNQKPLKNYWRKDAGSVGIMSSLSVIPLLVVGSMTLDIGHGVRSHASLQSAADAAVLAAATSLATGHSNTDRVKIANDAFHANLDGKLKGTFTATPRTVVDTTNNIVSMEVEVQTDKLLTELLLTKLIVGVRARARVGKGIPICMLSLNKTVKEALYVNGTADVLATGCSVLVNSHDTEALRQVGTGSATASHFCVAGNYVGSNFTPPPEPGCLPEQDPLKAKMQAAWSSVDQTCTESTKKVINTNGTVHLPPGVYCGGIDLKKGTVKLQTGGTYLIKDGEFKISAHGSLKGSETVILLGGTTSRIAVQGGADIDLSAPKTGPFSGIAIAQHWSTITPANKSNLVTGGGYINIDGIIYYPKQALSIEGNGEIGQDASQFAIIADTISVQGNGKLTIRIGADHVAAGLPKLPESKERVVLVN